MHHVTHSSFLPLHLLSFKDMARFVLKATKQHARNLAFFATIYKTLLIVQRRMHGKERPLDSFLAGLVGGYMVFGENNNVNQQVKKERERENKKRMAPLAGSLGSDQHTA